MTAHTQPRAVEPGSHSTSPPSLMRLRMRETALRQQAAQYQARAEHLERVGLAQAQQLRRRVDAHEKIVLGALVKKAGLDVPLSHTSDDQQRNDDEALPRRKGIARQSTTYDREFILGAFIWLADMLRQPTNGGTPVPDFESLRAAGMKALERR